MSNSPSMEELLNKDDSLYFYPAQVKAEGYYKIWCDLPGSYELTLSDITYQSKPRIMLEYKDEDDDRPAQVSIIESDSTIESMIRFLNTMDEAYHGSIFNVIYGWAVKEFLVSS